MNSTQRMQLLEKIQPCGWPQCGAACCIYGAWVEIPLVDYIMEHAEEIGKHLPTPQRSSMNWFETAIEAEPYVPGGQVRHTTTISDTAHYGGEKCIFLRADAKCALQVYSEAQAKHPWHFKPFFCVLHPLMLDENGDFTLDDAAEMVDEPASCMRASATETKPELLFAAEITFLKNKMNR